MTVQARAQAEMTRGAEPPVRPLAAQQTGAHDLAGEHLATLLARVIDRVRASAAPALGPYPGVLLDVVVDDVRCLLIVEASSEIAALSPREMQVARMVADGRTNQAIASALEISVWTVSSHVRRIFLKLGVGTRAEMVAHLLGPPGRSGPPG